MLASKRGADGITQFSIKNKRSCSYDLPGNNQGILSQLSEEVASNLARSVVLLVLTNGRTILNKFCAIAIECRSNVTKFVTSGSLVEDLQYYGMENKIEVHCEGNVVVGHLEEYDSECQLAVVKVISSLDVYCVRLNHGMEFMPRKKKIAAIRRDLFGNLIVTTGLLSSYGDKECLVFSDADKCSKNWLGAAFFDFDGNFVGMNHDIFLPPRIILEQSTSTQRRAFRYVGMNGWFETKSGEHWFHPKAYDCVDKELFQQLYPLGYPIPSRSMVNSGWVLLNTFEDDFGDVYPKGVWDLFRKKRFSSEISRSVVALASFRGETRFFACTGVFVDFDDKCPTILTSACLVTHPYLHNKIVEGLRIEVLLPNGPRVDGTLLHYSLHYNVALVSVKNYRALYPVNLKLTIPMELEDQIVDTKVLAVWRIFESGKLKATSGKITADTDSLDCGILWYSTCEVTKAAIGGPLVDVNGNYIGMNFIGLNKEIGTAYLYREDLRGILEYFKTKNTKYLRAYGLEAVVTEDGQKPKNKWPVPEPLWCDPSELKDHVNDKREDKANGLQTRYVDGIKIVLK